MRMFVESSNDDENRQQQRQRGPDDHQDDRQRAGAEEFRLVALVAADEIRVLALGRLSVPPLGHVGDLGVGTQEAPPRDEGRDGPQAGEDPQAQGDEQQSPEGLVVEQKRGPRVGEGRQQEPLQEQQVGHAVIDAHVLVLDLTAGNRPCSFAVHRPPSMPPDA